MGYLDDFGIIATGSPVREAVQASTDLHAVLGSDLEVGEAGYIYKIEFLGATGFFSYADSAPDAQLFLGCKMACKITKAVKSAHTAREIFLAQAQKSVGKYNFAQ